MNVFLCHQIKSLISSRRTATIIISVSVVLIFSAAPVYTVNKFGLKFSQQRNKTIVGLVFAENRERVESVHFIINNFFIPLTAFAIIVICTVAVVVKLRKTIQWRKKSITPEQADRVSSRNQKVANMVVMISTLFIICFIPICIIILAVAFEPRLFYGGRYFKIAVMLGGFSFVLESVNSSSNIFIYYHMSRKYRDTLRKMFSLTQDKNTV